MENKYSIKEVADTFGITTNKIRFYEKKGLINPERNEENEYRKYNDNDIINLQSILLFRSIGLTIEDVRDILDNGEKKNYLNHFNNQWKIVNDEIQRLTIIRNSLANVIDKLYEKDNEFEVTEDILTIIKNSNRLYEIKNNWKDKWNFDSWAMSYDESVKEDRGALKIYKNYDLILTKVYEKVIKEYGSQGSILEIGVGTGNLASKFLSKGCNIIGIDQSRDMLTFAKKKYPNLKLRLGEFLKIPYENKSFDVIVSTYAFHHLKDEEKVVAIEEMLRVLKDDGIIVMGDLMFENDESKEIILKDLSNTQKDEIEDEYYSNIEFLKKEFNSYDKTLEYEKIDMLNYIVSVS